MDLNGHLSVLSKVIPTLLSSIFANAADDTPTREASEEEDESGPHFNVVLKGEEDDASLAPNGGEEFQMSSGIMLGGSGSEGGDNDSASIEIGGMIQDNHTDNADDDDDDKLPSFGPSPDNSGSPMAGGGIDPGSTIDEDGIRESNSVDRLDSPDSDNKSYL